MIRTPLLISLSLSLLIACGDSGTNPDAGPGDGSVADTGPKPMANCPEGRLTICSLKSSTDPFHPGLDEPVSLTNVVVTTPTISAGVTLGLIYVQDPAIAAAENGKFSGVAVTYNTDSLVGAVPAPGTVVSIDGTYTEFGQGQKKQAQVAATRIEATGGPMVIQPVIVDPTQIATGGALSDALEGALVRVENMTSTMYNPDLGGGNLFGGYLMDPGGLVVWSDRNMYDLERSWDNGESFNFIQGVLRLGTNIFNADQSVLSPRSREDWDAKTTTYRTVAEIRAPGAMINCDENTDFSVVCTKVELDRVQVTGVGGFVSTTQDGGLLLSLWVQDPNPVDPKRSGIKVLFESDRFEGTNPRPNVGDFIGVYGEVQNYFGALQIPRSFRIRRHGDNAAPQATVVTPAEIALDAQTAADWYGSLVRIENVTVTESCRAPDRDFGDWIVTGNVLISGAFQYDYNGDLCDGGECYCDRDQRPNDQRMNGDTFQSITGVLDYSFNEYKLQPRFNSDLVR